MPEAIYRQEGDTLDYTPAAAQTAGMVVQLPSGLAGVVQRDISASAKGAVRVRGVVELALTDNIAILAGGEVYWDHSANKAHFKPVNDRDFYVGYALKDQAGGTSKTVYVVLNERPEHHVVLGKGSWTEQETDGLGTTHMLGGDTYRLEFDAVAEAATASLLSDKSWALAANAIFKARLTVQDNGDHAALDIVIGVANDDHASDADSITEAVLFSINGNDLAINAESDDGTTEVAATDTTKEYVVGAEFEVWIDTRNPADCQLYVDGVNVLPATSFDISAATGPLKAIVMMEKTSNDTVGKLDVHEMTVRLMEDHDPAS